MRGLVMLMLVALTVTLVSAGLAIWWAGRLLRRLRRRTRRLVDHSALTVKAHLAAGTARQVAAARRQLRTGVDQTGRMLEDAARRDCPLGDLPALFGRIDRLAVAVDAELQLLDGDRDAAQRVRLAAALRRSEELASMAAGIRRTVSGMRAEMQLDEFGRLQRDVDLELRALGAGACALRQPGVLNS